MRRLTLITSVVLALILAIYFIGIFVFWVVVDRGVAVHQRNVTRSLAEWREEYQSVSSHEDAVRTAEMLEYVQQYYVPSDGYRGTPESEAALQNQRQETVDAFVVALRGFTGKDFGADSAKWLEHLGSNQSK